MRLDKYLSEAGTGTRSEVKKKIRKGLVSVDGEQITDPGYSFDPAAVLVTLEGIPVRWAELEYYMLHKPKGVISASRDSGIHHQTTVTDLIRDKRRKDLFPVGRLDIDTEGLLLITNDGALAHRLLSPKKHVDKTYYTELDAKLTRDMAARLEAGVDIGDPRPTLPCRINLLSDNACLITIREGRYHEIKRMFQTEGRTVTALKRISMGPLSLDPALAPGEYRPLTAEEIALLKGLS